MFLGVSKEHPEKLKQGSIRVLAQPPSKIRDAYQRSDTQLFDFFVIIHWQI